MTKKAKKDQKQDKKLNQLQEQIDVLNQKWQRALADYQNLEKRVNRDKQEFVKYANESLIDKLLVVLDGLEAAQNHLNDEGLGLVLNQLESILKSEGVEPILAQHQEFDPETMDCSELVSGEKDKVINVVQKGYLLNGRVIRPAKVKVGSAPNHSGRGKKGGKQ